jgi:hypothetical protein
MSDDEGLTPEELEAQDATALPDKEVVSILDLNADLDLAIDAAAPIDLAVAANANVAAPIDAAVGANILSFGSEATAVGDQGVMIDQNIEADATANADQDSNLDQGDDTVSDGTTTDGTATDGTTTDGTATDGTATDGTATDGTTTTDTSLDGLTDGNLLNVNVDAAADADIAAPVNGAVAANANVAAPINAGVAANVGSVDSEAVAVSQQDAIIEQNIEGEAAANADQESDITQ